jgi:hypothetical protein
MPVVRAVPTDHPMMKLWNEYKASSDYATSRKYAIDPQHVDGSLWAAFCAGWNSRNAVEYGQPGPYNHAYPVNAHSR